MDNQLVEKSEIELQNLAMQINAEDCACKESARASLQHAINAGKYLLEAKAICAHGTFGNWLNQNCTVSERTAQVYMRIARGLPMLESKAQRVADLSLRDAIELLHTGDVFSDAESAHKFDAEFCAILNEFQQTTIVLEAALHNPNVSSIARDVATNWNLRFAELTQKAKRELGKLLNLTEDDIIPEVSLQIILRRDYPELARLVGLPIWIG